MASEFFRWNEYYKYYSESHRIDRLVTDYKDYSDLHEIEPPVPTSSISKMSSPESLRLVKEYDSDPGDERVIGGLRDLGLDETGRTQHPAGVDVNLGFRTLRRMKDIPTEELTLRHPGMMSSGNSASSA